MIGYLKWMAVAASAAVFAASALPASAQDYPERPIRFIVPFAAGGAADAFARVFAPPMSDALGQNVVVENMPGAGGAVAAGYVSQIEPDGYTLLMATPGTQITNPLLQANLPYDPHEDFTTITALLESPNVLVVPGSSPADSVEDLIEMARENPGELMFSSAGIGATSHLSGELFGLMAEIEIEHIPYQGSGEAMPDIVAGRVDMAIDTLAVVLPFIRSGEMKALAITTAEPHPLLPDVPTLDETLPDYLSSAVNYVLAPQGVPDHVVEIWNIKTAEVLSSDDMQEQLVQMGIAPYIAEPAELEARIASEQERWGEIIRLVGIEPQ